MFKKYYCPKCKKVVSCFEVIDTATLPTMKKGYHFTQHKKCNSIVIPSVEFTSYKQRRHAHEQKQNKFIKLFDKKRKMEA